MGYGDQLMAAGLAEELFASSPAAGPVTIVDAAGSARWQPLWYHNPALTTDGRRPLRCGHGCLPYLVDPRPGKPLEFSTTYRTRDHRGHLYLTDEELTHGRVLRQAIGPYIVVEPHGRDRKNPNRCWSLDRWYLVAALLGAAGLTVVQCHHEYTNALVSVHSEPVRDIRDGASILAAAALVVAPEGGIPFITAALAVPTVVLWGGCVSFEALHYPEQVNLVDADPRSPCGQKKPCDHCAQLWRQLTPDRVVRVVLSTLSQEQRIAREVANGAA